MGGESLLNTYPLRKGCYYIINAVQQIIVCHNFSNMFILSLDKFKVTFLLIVEICASSHQKKALRIDNFRGD